jgi:SAM-dependent methyltransferase
MQEAIGLEPTFHQATAFMKLSIPALIHQPGPNKLSVWLQKNRKAIERELIDSPGRKYFSPARYSQYEVTLPLLRSHVRGRLIDLGCGGMPYRKYVVEQTTAYHGLDIEEEASVKLTYVGDIQDMRAVKSESYDTAVCLEVLEHVPNPFQASREIHRILEPGGVLILSVPFLNRLHDEPYDYYRFTSHGLRHLLENAGFKIEVLAHRGGLFSFLGHQLSTLALALVWPVPVLKQVTWFLNSWLVTRTCYNIDTHLKLSKLLPLGYSVVAIKKGS